MSIIRTELRTGLLVLLTTAVLIIVILYLGTPGLMSERRMYRVYFDNASGINVGAPVMLAGRRIGQVSRLISPVPEANRPRPDLVVIVEVSVDRSARIFRKQRVCMLQYSLLGEEVVDFTKGEEASGLATEDCYFIGERQPGLSDVGQQILEKLDPVVGSATAAAKDLQKTSANLSKITEGDSDMVMAIANFRQLGERMVILSGTNSSLNQALNHLEILTGEEGPLSRALANAERFTGSLADNADIGISLSNFRRASENLTLTTKGLNNSLKGINPGIKRTVHNAEQFTDTVKHQPWRLIWPSTKKYPEDKAKPSKVVRPTPCRTPR